MTTKPADEVVIGTDAIVPMPGASVAHTPIISPEIDKLAYELFDRLRKEDCTVSIEDRRRFLTRAARNLLQISGTERGIIQSTLDALPQHQREAIILHLEGLTYEQIARRQRHAPDTVLKYLANAYAKYGCSWNRHAPKRLA